MSDFVQTMKDWRRMCNACQTEKDIRGVCGCYPAGNYATCAMKRMDKEADFACDNLYFERLEKTIKAWAEDHPEPKYPTWGEWLNGLHVVGVHAMQAPSQNVYYPIEGKMNTSIPADIAEKLGLQPKEG